MPSNGDQAARDRAAKAPQAAVPAQMVQQAAAAVAGNTNDAGEPDAPHAGHDCPMIDAQNVDLEEEEHHVPPPAYGEVYGHLENEENGMGTHASVTDDGRINIRIEQSSRKLSSLLVPALRHQVDLVRDEAPLSPPYVPASLGGEPGVPPPPPMNVVIHVVGSRGDVQPFVALGKVLKETYGHRVRLATHPVFQEFVSENGLEFFSIGGDPAQLMAFMVKNPGLMPGFDTLRSGDIGKRRAEIGIMVKGCWRSCIEAGDGTGIEASDETIENWNADSTYDEDYYSKPFVADAIIANPPSFAHIHCAEKLGIPLHIMFTMPYSPTQAFPHPLANIQSSDADPHLTNHMSYAMVDMMTWQGLGDVINRFRQKSLGLEPISLMWAPGMMSRLRVPHTYCWSPALIPKPKDWSQHISISGFFFLNLASNYTPAPDLKEFLDAGPPPVYIGFGSIVVDDPNGMTNLIFEAVKKTGQRALVSKGWGGFGADDLDVPNTVFMLGNVPHDWLFKHVSCIVHHGGAGTTAAGISAGRPTVVVPFFGDQPFWGAMVARAGAGPEPVPYKQLTADKLAAAINMCLEPASLERAAELSKKISKETGSDTGAQSFHQMLDVDHMRCSLTPSRVAVWRLKRTEVHLSALAACTLANENLLDFNDLKLYRPREFATADGPWDPITGGASALIGTMSSMMLGVADMPVEALKALKIHPDATKKAQETGSGFSSDGPAENDERSLTSAHGSTNHLNSPNALTPVTSNNGSTFNLAESMSKIQLSTSPLSPGSATSEWPSRARSHSHSHTNISISMADALQGQLGRSGSQSRPGSRSGSRRRESHKQSDSASRPDWANTALGTGKGVSRIVGAGIKSPMDFTLGLARGFHNAPKLYGDASVRQSHQVTDLRSGLQAATKEFGLGFYDGITGLVTQPVAGAKKEGVAGFVKGMAKGIGGIVLKPGAAIFGIPGYTFEGIYRELHQHFGSSTQNYIIAARTAQGYDDWQRSSVGERADIVARWKHLQKDLKKKKNPDEYVRGLYDEQKRKKKLWEETRQVEHERKNSNRQSTRHDSADEIDDRGNEPHLNTHGSMESGTVDRSEEHHLRHAAAYPEMEAEQQEHEEAEMEEAIHLSVAETSRGDPDEDAMIERAIRASMTELARARHEAGNGGDADSDSEAIRRAMQASIAEAQRHRGRERVSDADLERALAESLQHQSGTETLSLQHGDENFENAHPDQEHEEDFNRALEASKHPANQGREDPLHLGGTTRQEFENQHAAHQGEKTQQEKTEEQVVLEYVKRQSKLEEQHRKAAAGKARATESTADNEEEELRKAMELSLRRDGQHCEASGT